MIKKGDILTKKPSYQLLNARFYHTTDVLDAMQEYAEEYHQSELLKLNKSDVISSVCKTCGHPFDDDVCCGDCIDKQTD
jgi:hypothetical protein